MRKLLLFFGALLMIAGCSAHQTPSAEPTADKKPAEIETPQPDLSEIYRSAAADDGERPVLRVLPNGLQVLVKQDKRFPLAVVRLYVHAGSSYEDPAQAGISHLLEHMVFKGTAKRKPGESAEAVEAVGGQINAATSYDYTVYYAETPSDAWTVGLDVVTDMAFNAAISPKELASERKVVLSELSRGEDNPNSRLFKTLAGLAWKGTTYEWPIIGFEDTVARLSDQDIIRYIDRLYQPQSMMVVVVGDVNPDEVMREVRSRCGSLANDRVVDPAEPFATPKLAGPIIQAIPGKWNKVYLAAAFPIPGSTSAELPGLETLAQVMGGDETSRLYRSLKYERQLVDDVSMYALTLERGGLLYVQATLDAGKAEVFMQALSKEMAGMADIRFTDEEIARARLNLSDSLFLSKETLSGLASKLGHFQFFEGGYDREQDYLFGLAQVDAAELRRLAREYVRPSQMALAVLTPEDSEIDAQNLKGAVAANWPDTSTPTAKAVEAASSPTEEIQLASGSTIILLPDATLPYTGLSLFWSGGDGLLQPDEQGLAELASRALPRGTQNRSATAIEDFLSDRAASLSARSGRETFQINAKYPARFGGDMLELVQEVLLRPAFEPGEVQRARSDQIAAIRRSQDRPLGLAFRQVFPFLFSDAPYSYIHEGDEETVAQFGAEDIKAYWEMQRKRPFVLAVCGQADREEIMNFARKLDAALSPSMGPYAPPAAAYTSNREKDLVLPDRNQAHILALFPVPGKGSEDTPGLSLLRAALAGQSGLLFRDLRDAEGLGYSVTAFLWQATGGGFMAFYIGTTPDQVDKSVKGFEDVTAMLATTPLDGDEMARAKNILSGEYYLDHQTLLSRSREAASLTARGYSRKINQEMVDKAKALGPEDLMLLARKYLNWKDVRLMKVLP